MERNPPSRLSGRYALFLAATIFGAGGVLQAGEPVAPSPKQLPTGGKVVAGSATLTTTTSPEAALLSVDQTTQRAIINWDTFDLGSAAQIDFNQPNSNAATLNRVLDSNPSRIFGRITGTGQVFLSNPNGVYFSKSSTVDVGSLAATTHSIGDDAFMAGDITFMRDGATGSVENEGELRAALGGYIALLAPEVRNGGIIVARMGTVAMASGESITLNFDGTHLAGITARPSAIAALVENRSAILAPGGTIILSAKALDRLQGGVVRNSGVLEATSLASRNGRIVLEASDRLEHSGTLDVSGTTGGSGTLTADRINLTGGSVIDASGLLGGGEVFVGGGFHGKDLSIANARQVVVAETAKIDASANQSGDGGKVAVWSDDQTHFAGSIRARGGSVSGAGGFVEVSGKQQLNFLGAVDAGATHGAAGTLLLDPHDITIDSVGVAVLADLDGFGDIPALDSIVAPATIAAVTNTGTDVTLQANNDITVNSSILTVNPGGDGGALIFQAGRSITVNASINSDNGDISFTANDGSAIGANREAGNAVFTNNSLIDAGAGTVSITMGTQGDSGIISTGQITAANLDITHNGPTPGAVTGLIDLGEINVTGNLNITADSARNVVNTVGNVVNRGTATISVGTGDVTIDRATTDFNIIGLTAGNVVLNDMNAVRFATTTLSGDLTQASVGPTASTGAIQVAGAASFTANDGGFGYADPYIDLTNAANDFAGGVTFSVSSVGGSGSGGYATVRDSGAIDITAASLAAYLTVTAAGAVDLGPTTVGTHLTVTTSGAITDSGTLTVPLQTTLTAGAANDITLDDAGNNFGSVQIVSSDDTTLVDINAINFGYYSGGSGAPSHISGALDLTAGGDISQTQYNFVDGYSAITVDGATTFTANHATLPISLYLGPNDPFSGFTGQANTFTGGITLARNNTDTGFTNVQLRNISSAASVLTGLTSVGALNNVFLRYDNAPSVTLPGMTLSGSLKLYAPSVANTAGVPANVISQTGAIVVAQDTMVQAASSGDVVLSDAGNDFNRINVIASRNTTLVDANAVILYGNGYASNFSGDLSVTAGGDITDGSTSNSIYYSTVGGTATLDSGVANITLDNNYNRWNIIKIPAANNVVIHPYNNIVFDDSVIAGTLYSDSLVGGTLTQLTSTAVTTGGTTTFTDFVSGITLAQSGNVFGALALNNYGTVNLRENDAITQASAWNDPDAVTLTTSNDQAITLDQANRFGALTITQINSGAGSAGAVYVRETNDSGGMTQGGAWTVHGTTQLDSGSFSINLTNANNVFGPMQVLGATGGSQSVNLYAKDTATADAFSDVGGPGAWNTGSGTVRLIAYGVTGTTPGGGNISLQNTGNVLGDLYIKAADVTITENATITDGAQASWSPAGDTGWVTTGTTNLVVANPAGKAITLDNVTNQLGALGVATTGTPGTLSSVLITDNTNITQASAWILGAAPVTLDARTHEIDLSTSGNVLGNIFISTANGTPTALSITEDDAITQGAVWTLTGVPVTLLAENDNAITLANASNIMGNLTVTGGVVSITENDNITQSGAWTTTGTTTLNPTAGAITLTNAANVMGALAISGTPSAVSITENDDITQASAWVQGAAPFTLIAGGGNDIVLSQASNQLGDLTLTAQNATITENQAGGITDAGAWTIPGTTTLTAGSANPIVLNANPAGNFGTVSIVSASNADIADVDGIIFGTSTIASGGTLTVTAGGEITQIGSITAPSLRLIGTGYATLTNVLNNVGNLAAGFSGGALEFVDSDDFVVAVVGGTSGVTIGANDVTLTSVNGTITGLSTINASSTSLVLSTGTALAVPQMNIAGPQTYTASTVSGIGIVLNGSLTSTSAGAITFNSPVTLGADLAIQTSNSAVDFMSTLAGANNQLTINAGSGLVAFHDTVSGLGNPADPGAALTVSAGGTTFDATVAANNGLAIGGPVVFSDTVTLGDGSVGSLFTGLVTLGKVGGMDFSGYDGVTFNAGVLLQNGPATINSNNSALAFQTAGTVSGPYDLTLNSGTQLLTGLDRMGADLTSLTVTALSPTIPVGGVSIAGPQTYTATSGSSITLNGNVTSTAAGAITFNSPVTVGAAATVSSDDSEIVFSATVNGNNDLTVDSGTAAKTFSGAVGASAALGDASGAALILQGAGTATFASTVQTRSGITAAAAVIFNDDVTLGDGDTGSVFTGLVTSGGADGNSISGFDGVAFDGGLTLAGGPVSVVSNGSTLSFGAAVSGAQDLSLNALAGGAGTVTGLEHIGFTSTLTRLDIVAQTLSLPATGLAVTGPMSFTAAGGITLNGAVGNSAGPATGQIDFNGPVTLATGAITVTTDDAAVNFSGTVDGAQALNVNAGAGVTTFANTVGDDTALASLTTDAGGTTAINGGSITTSGAQTYNDAVSLGADTTLTGVNVQFLGTLDGAHTLTVNNSGPTVFAGIVGGNTALTSLTTDVAGTVVVNTTAVTTTGTQTYNENMTLGADAVFTGNGLVFADIDGANAFTADAGSGALQLNGTVGGATPLTSVAASGNTIVASDVTTGGAQAHTAIAGITLNGDLATTASSVTITGPTTLGDDVAIVTTGGNIIFSGVTSAINGEHDLTLTAGAGDVVRGGLVGGITPLSGVTISGNDLTLPDINTVGDANQSYTALNDITLSQSRTLNAPAAFTADSDGDGDGSFILLNGVSLTVSNNMLDIVAADLDLQGSSTMSTGGGLMSFTATNGRNIALGGADAPGQMTISGSELSRISSNGGLNLITTGTGWIRVNGISAAQSQNINGTLGLNAQGTGEVGFITAASTFNAVTANAAGGTINIGVDLTTSNDAINFVTPVAVSGGAINSGGGDITFGSTLAVDSDLTLTTANGALTFAGAVGSNQTLTLNLGGGSVSGLQNLQSTLTGLTVNGTSGITLPAFTINGPQVYNTGSITVTGNLGGVGIAFNNVVDVIPASGTALTLDAGAGTLTFANVGTFNAVDMTLIGDEIDFSNTVTGTGSLSLAPSTISRNVAVRGSGAPIAGLNLTATELAWLPIGTLTSLTVGNPSGTGTLDVAGVLNIPGTPLTLNGGGGISQSGGAIISGSLTLYAAGNGISLADGANAFGAVAINGTPSAVNLLNTLDITQLGAAAWNLGSAPVTLDVGTHDIILDSAGNTFGTLVLTAGNAQVAETAATDLGASTIGEDLTIVSGDDILVSGALVAAGNVTFTAAGLVTQTAPLTIGGNLDVSTTANVGDVTIANTGAAATVIGDTYVGGFYDLIATGQPVSQAAGSTLQVRGDLTVTGDTIVLGGAGNLVGGTTTLPATSTAELRQAGVITLGDRTDAGNLTVISERTNRSFSSALVNDYAIVLNNGSNNITGSISVSASPPTVASGADVQTGINQTAGTSISVAGVASFTAEASSAGSLGIDLTNDGNSFGVLQLSGTTVNVRNAAAGTTTIGSALATVGLTLTTAGALAQTGPIAAPDLVIAAAGTVALNNAANAVDTIDVTSGGNTISYVDANGIVVAGLDAGGAGVSLTAGSAGSLTQTGALLDVGTLVVSAGGAVTLTNAGNTIDSLAASVAGTGFDLFDSADGLAVSGIVRSAGGEVVVRTSGDLTLDSGGRLQADAGGVVASTEGAGNFINNADASALVVGSGQRWLVYSGAPDLASGPHTVKGGLTSSFRRYGDTYATYLPGAVAESGNGFIYSIAAPSLTVSAAITGTPSHVYGDTPTGTLGYSISAGFDSEDNVDNIITGGTAAFSTTLSDSMNAGSYEITYTGGLTSSYTLTADTIGADYTVTPAALTYTADPATRIYGAVNPVLSGTISGFKLGQDASILGGSASWTTPAVAGSDVGQYAITGSGYTVGGNYTFTQAAGNATAFAVTRAPLTVAANDDTRIYDGSVYSGGVGVMYGAFANGEDASVLGGTLVYGGTAQGARNAGTYAISASGLTATNYDISYVDGALVIDRADVTLTSADVTKTYDGMLAASGSATVAAGSQLFGGDTVSGGIFAFTDANAGAGNKTVTVTGVTVSDGNGGGNYNVSYVTNNTSTINPANLVVSTGNVSKTYDGTLAANGMASVVSGTLFSNVSNGNTQDSLSGGSFAFTDPNAGAGNKVVTVTGVTASDGNGGNNYAVTYADNTTSTIERATLTFAGTVQDKEYDGAVTAALSGYALTGFVGSETVNAMAGAATFADKNAGMGKAVTISGITLSDGDNGGLASNYLVSPSASATGTIAPKQLTLDAVAADKVYDGTTTAMLDSFGLSGFVGSETVTGVYTGSASFSDKNVGADKAVTITGISLMDGTNGGLATNYALPASASSTADITPATLNIAGVVAMDKIYDGTVTANLNTQAAALTGAIGSDDVDIGSITGTFTTKDVGTDKAIGAGTVVLAGTDASNYVLIQPTGLTASITPRSLTVSATGIDKVYDGTTAATVDLLDNRIVGDELTITSTETFIDKNAGMGKFVGVSGITLGGTDAGNYTVNSSTSTFASITRANLAVTATGASKVYDGTIAAVVTLAGAPLAGDVVDLTYTSASFADKNVGAGKAVSVDGVILSGADAGNYAVGTVDTTADITPATLVVGATGQSKEYDGTIQADVALTDNRIVGDQLVVAAGAAEFNNANVGEDKPVTVTGIQIAGGADSGNYLLASNSAVTTADITGEAPAISARTWSLPPAMPELRPAVAPLSPPEVLDLSLPLYRGDAGTRTRIVVSIVSQPLASTSGPVLVQAPKAVALSDQGFSFVLPVTTATGQPSAADEVTVTLTNGGRLPSWLQYRADTKTFSAPAVPDGALPIEVLVRAGGRSWTLLIEEQMDRGQ